MDIMCNKCQFLERPDNHCDECNGFGLVEKLNIKESNDIPSMTYKNLATGFHEKYSIEVLGTEIKCAKCLKLINKCTCI